MSEPNFVEAAKRLKEVADRNDVPGYVADDIDTLCSLFDPTPADAEQLESIGWFCNGDIRYLEVRPTLILEYGKNSRRLYVSDSKNVGATIMPLIDNPTRGQVAAAMLMFSMGGE